MALPMHPSDTTANPRTGRLVALCKIFSAANHDVLCAWGLWAFISLAAFSFVAIFSLPFPFGDEWEWIGRVTGDEPVTFTWLWSQHNEHRMLVPRLIYLGLGELTGFDFRAGAFFNVFILSSLSASMMLAARTIRGKTRYYDAFFPFVFLHWGQAENLIWGFQLNFITSVVLEGIVLLFVLRCNTQTGIKSYLSITICLLLLGSCGTYGLVFLPPMVCWMIFVSISKWQSGCTNAGYQYAKRDSAIILAFAVILAAFVALYFYGLHTSVSNPSIFSALQTGVQFLSFGIGPAAKAIWPFSGLLILVVCSTFVWQCLKIFIYRPAERIRTAGLLMYFGGILSLAAAIGWGRAYIGPMAGFEVRYMTLAVPLLPLIFFHCEVYGNNPLKHHLPRAVLILIAVLFVVNAQKGMSYSINLRKNLANFEQDMRDDVPPDILGDRYAGQWGYGNRELFTTRLVWLRNSRLGPYHKEMPK
jgi:hypothetical protein